MRYQVVPFQANVSSRESADTAAKQLERLINEQAQGGWRYSRLETLTTDVVTEAVPGDNGCMGIGATPGRPEIHRDVDVYVAVFHRED